MDRRRGSRVLARLRVTSRELPGQEGVTMDLSDVGMQIETSGPVSQGELLRCTLPEMEITFVARVSWHRQLTSRHLLGLNFERFDKVSRAHYNALLDALSQNQEGI